MLRARLHLAGALLLLLDAGPLLAAWFILCSLTERPIFGATVVAGCAMGLAIGNRAKQAASSEPLVFTDGVLGSIFFYPSLYAEFVTPPALLLCLSAAAASFAAFAYCEPRVLTAAWPGVVAAALGTGVVALCPVRSLVRRLLAQCRTPSVTGQPDLDAAAFGPIASVIVHSAVAQGERAARRLNRSPQRSDSLPASRNPAGPVVMLQLESFFDARRLGRFVPADLLPHFDRCIAGSIQHGQLRAPSYGANTVRTEFAALTGLPEAELGLDRFNPYAAFARVPIDSIAWRLRAAGFHTICLHPFAGSFYGRHRVIPNLGFDQFLDIGAFARYGRSPGYIPDLTVVQEIERLLAEHGPRTFVFAITMGNHSPWQSPAVSPLPDLPQAEALGRFLAGLAQTDAAVGAMAATLRRSWPGGLLAAFGDHLPSFPTLYRHLQHRSRTTDYVLWQANRAFGERVDIAAHDLPGHVLRAAEPSLAGRATARVLT
jgi:hypothetical protein